MSEGKGKYFVMGYVTGYDMTEPPHAALLTRREFPEMEQAKQYLTTIHEGHKPFIVAVVEGAWVDKLADEHKWRKTVRTRKGGSK